MNNASPSDLKALFLQVAEEDRNAFRAIFDHYRAPFYAAAFKMTRSAYTAEEIVQEVFILLWTKRALVAAADNPPAYFFSMLQHCIYAHFKKMAAEKHLKATAAQQATDLAEDNVEKLLQAKERRQLLDAVISQLPPRQQLVYKLSKQQGMSRYQIAHELNISPNSVRNHLHDAIKSIRLYLKDNETGVAWILLLLYCRF